MKFKIFKRYDDVEDILVIENYSDEVQEIMTSTPKWIIRRGVTIISFILLVILFVSYVVKYPDIVKTTVTITSTNSPAEIKAKASGRINLLVKDGDFVKKDKLLGFVENTSNIEHIDLLTKELLANDKAITSEKYENLIVHENLRLGEIQDAYSAFSRSVKEFKLFLKLESYKKNTIELNKQIEVYGKIEDQIVKQRDITVEEFNIAKNKVSIDSILLKQKVIAPVEYQVTLSKFLPYKKSIEQFDQTIINNKLRVEEIKSRISETDINYYENKNKLVSSILSSYYSLTSQINLWKQRYIFTSPIAGKISYFKFWNNNQNINLGETVMSIVPNKNNIFCYMLTPITGSGKIQVGQIVNIKLDNYPFNEFGLLKGRIKTISSVPQENNYAIIVELPQNLITTQNKKLEFKEQMKGNGEIITKDLRLIERFFYQINKAIENFDSK